MAVNASEFVVLQRARKENAKIKEQIEKEKKRKEDSKSTLKKPLRQPKLRAAVVDITGVEDKEGVLDDLIATLQSGQAFKRPGKKATKKVPANAQNSTGRPGRVPHSSGGPDYDLKSGVRPSPLPSTSMANNVPTQLPSFIQQHPSTAPLPSPTTHTDGGGTNYTEYTNGRSPYSPRNKAPPLSGGPSLAEEILSNLRSTTTVRNSDGLPSTML